MKAAGYTLEHPGFCHGISCMAMQAFFVDSDMDKFIKRLNLIESIPIEDFKNDFPTFREKLVKEGKTPDEINQIILDIRAFFDGVALNQAPRHYKDWFENPDNLSSQNAVQSMPLTSSIELSSKNCYHQL